ncbi:MAG TPA: heparan-alpha-glucosaminide N-acetyltransferase domain-containing protein [Terriglobia bacterium]|nr:heparan-alpha-glucosaminide N-acetyltransferase domain-containing protein [Terriglobia bacterium]
MIKNSNRLAYLDWMRGLAVVLMLQGHIFDGWVRRQDRAGEWFWLSQFLGGFPAPIFLFLVGVSLALVLDRMRARGASCLELARKVLRRGIWILLLAYVFRVEQFLVWYPASTGSDVFRVDTLNCIAVCTLIIGFLSIAFKTRRANIIAMGLSTCAFVYITPWVYPLRSYMPSFVLSYLNGNGHPWYFSVFPWAAFTLAGITFGYVLLEARNLTGESEFFKGVAGAGICIYALGVTMSLFPALEYGFFDYSLTSPHYFLVRLGWILLILYGAYKWSARETAGRWSPLIVFGQASLPVYWVHIELVYGRPLHSFGQSLELAAAATHLLWFVPLMLALAMAGDWRRLAYSLKNVAHDGWIGNRKVEDHILMHDPPRVVADDLEEVLKVTFRRKEKRLDAYAVAFHDTAGATEEAATELRVI